MKPKQLSVSYEIAELCAALEAARMVASALHNEQLDTEQAAAAAPRSVAAVVGLVVERLRLLSKAVHGSLDPRHLWCHHNAALIGDDAGAESEDIILTEWSRERRRRESNVELGRTGPKKGRRKR